MNYTTTTTVTEAVCATSASEIKLICKQTNNTVSQSPHIGGSKIKTKTFATFQKFASDLQTHSSYSFVLTPLKYVRIVRVCLTP